MIIDFASFVCNVNTSDTAIHHWKSVFSHLLPVSFPSSSFSPWKPKNNKLKVNQLSCLTGVTCPLPPSFLVILSTHILGSCTWSFQKILDWLQISGHWVPGDAGASKSKRALCSAPPALSSLLPLRVFVIPRWAKQTCVYRFTVAGRGGLSVCRPALCLSHCETQQQLDFSLTAC